MIVAISAISTTRAGIMIKGADNGRATRDGQSQPPPGRAHRHQLCGHHQIASDQLVELIATIHRALITLGGDAVPDGRPREPAVPIRRSVQRDYVVCLECGFRATMLRSHLRVRHGLDVAEYRARWNLPAPHPLTAPAYSERRSAMAKALGFGRRRRSLEAPAAPSPRRPTTP
jgi:predicted transcriptional regulator